MTLAPDSRTNTFQVIIPAFNARATVAQAIQSAIEAGADRVIVVDDGSTDDTAGIAESLGARVARQSNAGAMAARSHGLALSTATYVTFLDADDTLVARGVRSSIARLVSDTDLSLSAVAGRIRSVDPNGHSTDLPPVGGSAGPAELISLGRGPWPPGAAVIRRDRLIDADHLVHPPIDVQFAEDYQMFLRLSFTGRLEQHDEPSLHYSRFAGKSARNAVEAIRDRELIRQHYADALGLGQVALSSRAQRGAAALFAARAEFARGRNARGIGWSARAVLTSPVLVVRKFGQRHGTT